MIFFRRDAYGFKQPTQWVKLAEQLEFEQSYHPILEHQHAKWKVFLEEHQGQWPPVSSKCKLFFVLDQIKKLSLLFIVKRYVRKGIPHDLRGKASE